MGFGFHRQVYYAHLAPTALACSKPQLFSQHLFLAFIVLDVKTSGVCNSALVWGVGVSGDGGSWFISFVSLCSKHRKSFLFKSVLIAKSEGNLCYHHVSKNLDVRHFVRVARELWMLRK